MKRWMIVLSIALGLAAVGAAGYYGYVTSQVDETPVAKPPTVEVTRGEVVQSVTAPGALVDTGETTLQSAVSGRVEQVNVRPGDRVKKGQTLAVLGDRERFELAVTDAKVKLIEAQAALAAQQSGVPLAEAQVALAAAQDAHEKAKNQRASKDYARTSQDAIDVARARYMLAEEAASDAEARFDRVDDRPETDPERAELLSQLAKARQERDQALANLNWLTSKPGEKEIAEADAALALAAAQLEEAQRKYDQILKDGGPDLALANARVQQAQAVLADAQSDLESLEIKAPFDGAVVDAPLKAGQSVAEGAALITLTDPHKLEAQVTVVEEDLPLVLPGQAVQLFFDAVPEANVTGKVARIVPRRASGDRAVYTVYLTLDEAPKMLASGMTVDASIVIQSRADVLRLPRAVVRARSDGSAQVEVWVNDHAEPRTVQVGLRGDSFVEILSGLEAGEQVVSQ